ncbi:AfsR/SARP family transcriptional regulator [Rhabdothermincola salaria]|uniref:AfsR/SARP family transcriptional regulator n=1 Tax=Rhabdothermincola salaria TaxID=2903142 RepID=UPI001E34BA8A|nr:BTAD domain-containing putative transcriptional regulator [Rhabdothermincola salaria]MCD9625682.1 winged helix-turn-helix domain-containing protein [Rhabdothermincola salaria]
MGQHAFEVLGPLRVTGPSGDDLSPRGPLQRRLLGALLLEHGKVVSTDRLAEVLWGDRLPQRAPALLHSHVFRLRQQLPELDIEARPHGYQLDVPGAAIDAWRFEQAVSRACMIRPDDPDGALVLLDEALGSWRGEAFADLADTDAGRIEATRLSELRLLATEERFTTALHLGLADEALPDLEAFVRREPLRERPRELLMDALTASGRRADALRVYDSYRRQLAEELGVDPSAHLRRRHEQLLDAVEPADGGPRRPAPREDVPPADRHEATGFEEASLPRPVSSFVGRDELLGALAAQATHNRLLTLVGPGGVGKTRLVTELVHRIVDDFPDGRPFCDLTPVDGAGVAAAVASAFGIEPRAGVAPAERIAEVVRREHALLVLDNCEHVLDEVAGLVEDLVRSTEHLVVITTSRERLAVEGERIFAVDPLGVGGETSPAFELFVDRARAASSTFELDEASRIRVVRLCERLDGLPLAIELAASRLRSLTLEEITEGLESSTSVLRGGRRTVPRHRSLDAALTWSYRLLDDDERDVLAAAASFLQPFDVADVAAVAERPTADVRDVLADLVERSLVHRVGGRFSLLQVVRLFVNERTEDRADLTRLSLRHANRVAERAETANRVLRTALDDTPIADVRALVPDLRQAMTAALSSGDADLAVRLVVAVRDAAMHAMLPELMAWGEPAGELGDAVAHPLAADAFSIAALAAWKAGDLDAMRRLLQRAGETLARGGERDRYEHQGALGTEALAHGALDDAVAPLRRALECPEAVDDVLRQAEGGATLVICEAYAHRAEACTHAERLLTDVAPRAGAVPASWCWYAAGECLLDAEPMVARGHLQRAVELARAGGATFVEGVAGASLASLDARSGDTTAAVGHYRWLLPLWLRAGVRSPLRTMLRTVTELLCQQGFDDAAARLLGVVTAPGAGHEVVGDDDVRLRTVRATLERRMGRAQLEIRLEEGRALDDAAAAQEATAAFDQMA